jgi:hypothetical protein
LTFFLIYKLSNDLFNCPHQVRTVLQKERFQHLKKIVIILERTVGTQETLTGFVILASENCIL